MHASSCAVVVYPAPLSTKSVASAVCREIIQRVPKVLYPALHSGRLKYFKRAAAAKHVLDYRMPSTSARLSFVGVACVR